MKTFRRIALATIAALTVAASMSATQTAPTTTAAATPPLTSTIADTAAATVSDAVKSVEQKAVTRADEKVAAGEQKVSNAKVRATTLRQKYLGYLSQVPKASRAKYQSIAAKSGYQKAITAIRTTLGK